MKSYLAIVGLVGALVACSRSTVPPQNEAPAQTAEAPARAHHRAPFVLEIEGPAKAKTGETIEVRARLDLAAPAPAPIRLSIEVPDASKIEGTPVEELPAGTSGVVERSWQVQLGGETPVAVIAQMQGEGFGATARKELVLDGEPRPPVRSTGPGGLVQPAR